MDANQFTQQLVQFSAVEQAPRAEETPMSLFGSLFSAVTGLNAQSQAMAMISDNVANVNTVSYKAAEAQFSTLVTRSASAAL